MACWKKKRLSLTKDQRERGVVFSSALVRAGEREADTIHEVIPAENADWRETIRRLEDVRFFKGMARDMGWDVTEIVRS